MNKLIAAIVFLPVFLVAQELEAVVAIIMVSLTIASKERLVNFEQDIQNYLNNTSFSAVVGIMIKSSVHLISFFRFKR